ncbi:MAG TPA: TIGR04283 family arsenosugar biosynthesis glycosyltransferase, partial [Burkholderiales bacterium]|nr:TIGR04283 family arsenosugar biosynthesis glycosyltransferase [Burkholderiales bacterium]
TARARSQKNPSAARRRARSQKRLEDGRVAHVAALEEKERRRGGAVRSFYVKAELSEPTSVSVIIPTLNEAATLRAAIDSARCDGMQSEIIIVDGGSFDGTIELSEAAGCTVLRTSPAQRARQMNAGARAARADVLVFLHADTHLASGALGAICEKMRDPHLVGGAFVRRYDSRSRLLALTCQLAAVRNRLWGWHLGDQAMFVRASVFRKLGGFAEIAIFEDLDFSRRLGRSGRIVTLCPPVISSGRRFAERGPLRTTLHDLLLTCGYLLHGIDRREAAPVGNEPVVPRPSR